MVQTAATLIAELATRLRSYATFSGTADGTRTTIYSTDLQKYVPQDVPGNLNWWVYCLLGSNTTQEARAKSFASGNSQLTLYSPGFINATLSGNSYQGFSRLPRERFLAALNDGIGQLGYGWQQDVIDETITTAQNTWAYTLSPATYWMRVHKVEIQISTDADQATYPYMDASAWDWNVRQATDSNGVVTWTLQFATQPPIGRKLRIYGDAYYVRLANDIDKLQLPPQWEGMALSWLYEWAQYKLWDELSNGWPTGDGEKARQKALDKMTIQKDLLLDRMRVRDKGRIIVPGHGQGELRGSENDVSYLGAFGNQH